MVGLSSIDEEMANHGHREDLFPAVVREAIDALPDRLKQVLLLSEMAGMTYTEIAATMGVKEGTVGSRRARALAMLREGLQMRGVRWDDCR
jgi:RNA polymerase sigma-70 factor (ECF subfamily)